MTLGRVLPTSSGGRDSGPRNTNTFRDKQTGEVVSTDPSSPVGQSNRFEPLGGPVRKEGVSTAGEAGTLVDFGTTSPNGGSFRTPPPSGGSSGFDLEGLISSLFGGPVGVSSLLGTSGSNVGQSGFSGFDFSKFNLGGAPTEDQSQVGGQENKTISDLGFGSFSLANQGTLSPEQVAAFGLEGALTNANIDQQVAAQNLQGTIGLLGGQFQQGADLIQKAAGIGAGQAEREKQLSLDELANEKAAADLEYDAAVQQISENRANENEFLKQKLASAGAIDSTAGVTILTRSAEKYDSILGNLSGQRQIALSNFANAETKVRNTYVNTVENISITAQQLATQLTQSFQTSILGAIQTFTTAQGDARKAQTTAFSNYISTLFDIQEAKKEAEAAAAKASAEAQQQAFENAVSLAGLTGTYVDPITGETVRTLNGLKFDQSMLSGSARGSGTAIKDLSDSEVYSLLPSLLQTAFQYGIVDDAEYNRIIESSSSSNGGIGAEARVNLSLLQQAVSSYENALGVNNPAVAVGNAFTGGPNLGGFQLPGTASRASEAAKQAEFEMALSNAIGQKKTSERNKALDKLLVGATPNQMSAINAARVKD